VLTLLGKGLFYKEIASALHIKKLQVQNRTEAINKHFGKSIPDPIKQNVTFVLLSPLPAKAYLGSGSSDISAYSSLTEKPSFRCQSKRSVSTHLACIWSDLARGVPRNDTGVYHASYPHTLPWSSIPCY